MRKAVDPATGQEYQIEMPTREEVKKAIFDTDFHFPSEGIQVKDAAFRLAQRFRLSEKQKQAKTKSRNYVFRYDVVRPVIEKELVQPGGPRTPYFLPDAFNKARTTRKVIEPRIPYFPPNPPPLTIEERERTGQTAEKSVEANYQQLQGELAADLLEKIKSKSSAFFEELVIDLLVAMGYGGSREEAGRAVGGSGDGGIDGVINEDILGLDVIYVQAKRWEGNVSRPEIHKFAGALQGQRARKGIFITTSDFTREARDYVTTIDYKIVLIDGDQLAQFMIDHNVGVSVVKSYEIKRVDSDYFAEEGE